MSTSCWVHTINKRSMGLDAYLDALHDNNENSSMSSVQPPPPPPPNHIASYKAKFMVYQCQSSTFKVAFALQQLFSAFGNLRQVHRMTPK